MGILICLIADIGLDKVTCCTFEQQGQLYNWNYDEF